MRGIASKVVRSSGSGPVGGTTESSTSASTCCGVLLRVLLRHLGAVGGAPQHELFVAQRLAQRLDVGDGVEARVEGAFGADLFGARFDQLPAAVVGAGLFEAVAGERVRVAGAALVEHDQIARVEDRPEQFGERFGERDRRLPRPAGKRNHRGVGFADGREAAADRQRDRPGRRPRWGRAARSGARRPVRCFPCTERMGSRPPPGAGAGRQRAGRDARGSERGRQERDGELPDGRSHQLESTRSDSGGAPVRGGRGVRPRAGSAGCSGQPSVDERCR